MTYGRIMHVMAPRETWSDDRLDEFKVEINGRFDKLEGRFEKLEGRFDKLIFALFSVGGSIIVALIGLLGVALL